METMNHFDMDIRMTHIHKNTEVETKHPFRTIFFIRFIFFFCSIPNEKTPKLNLAKEMEEKKYLFIKCTLFGPYTKF